MRHNILILAHVADCVADWLVERKKIPGHWQDMVREVREQVTAALTELPDVPEITDMLKGKCKYQATTALYTGIRHAALAPGWLG